MAAEGTRIRQARSAAIAVGVALIVVWLAWPLVGLLSSWLMLPPNFRPLATLLLMVIVAMAGVTGWIWGAEDEPEDDEDGPKG